MRFTALRDDLVREMGRVQGVAKGSKALPITEHVLLATGSDEVKLSASDTEVSIKTTSDASVKAPGLAVLPAKKVYDLVRSFKDGAEVSFDTAPDCWTSIKSGRSSFRVAGLDPERFP